MCKAIDCAKSRRNHVAGLLKNRPTFTRRNSDASHTANISVFIPNTPAKIRKKFSPWLSIRR